MSETSTNAGGKVNLLVGRKLFQKRSRAVVRISRFVHVVGANLEIRTTFLPQKKVVEVGFSYSLWKGGTGHADRPFQAPF